MKIDLYNPLASLKADAIKLFSAVDDHLGRVKRELDELNSETAKAKYSPSYLQSQIAHVARKAKADAAERQPEILALAARIETARQAWTTAALMRRAKLMPESDDVNAQILAELRYMRTLTDIQVAPSDELVGMAGEAARAGNLGMLEMLRKESTRREYSTSLEKMQVQTALSKAISEVDIPEQKQALAMLAETELSLEAAQDTLTEISTGKETDRAKMRRVMAEQAARRVEQAEE